MRVWSVGILLFVVSASCANLDDGDDYDIKRFHIPSRYFNEKPQCVEIRHKRSTRAAESPSVYRKVELPDEVETVDADDDADDVAVVIKNSDLAGKFGILVVQNSSPSKNPLLFEVRPVSGNSKNNKYLKMKIFDDSSSGDDDEEISQNFGDSSVGDDVIDDFDDYSEDYNQQWGIENKLLTRKQSANLRIVEPERIEVESQSNRGEIRILILSDQGSRPNKNKKNQSSAGHALRNSQASTNCIIIEKEQELRPNSDEETKGRRPNNGYGLRKRYKGKRKHSQ